MKMNRKVPKVTRLSKKQGTSLLHRRAVAELGISGATFVRRWREGKFSKKACDRPEIVRVAMLLPFAK